LLLTIPIVIYSPTVQHLLGFHPPALPGSTLIAPVLGTVMFFYGGSAFLTGRGRRGPQPTGRA